MHRSVDPTLLMQLICYVSTATGIIHRYGLDICYVACCITTTLSQVKAHAFSKTKFVNF